MDRTRAPRTAPAKLGGRPPAGGLDSVDRAILVALGEDGRLSTASLAERVGVSRAGAYARLERLRGEGVLTGASVRVDPTRVGVGITALVQLSCRQPAWRVLRERVASMPEVEWAGLVTGEHDAVLLVRVPDVETLRDVLLERLQAIEGVHNTETVFVLEEVVHRPFVLPSVPATS
ncbi:MAG: Lrp/AsnC family transcriptional regulator [Candidatus Dormibacteria bacterium]